MIIIIIDNIYFVLASITTRTHFSSRLPFSSTTVSIYILLGTPYDVDIDSIIKQQEVFLKNSVIVMHFHIPQNTEKSQGIERFGEVLPARITD